MSYWHFGAPFPEFGSPDKIVDIFSHWHELFNNFGNCQYPHELRLNPLLQNYNIRYQNNRDYEHSFGQSYQNSQLELLEEIEELDELEKIEESVNSAKPYIFMVSAIVLILVSVALILKTIFCKSNSLHEDIKHFT